MTADDNPYRGLKQFNPHYWFYEIREPCLVWNTYEWTQTLYWTQRLG